MAKQAEINRSVLEFGHPAEELGQRIARGGMLAIVGQVAGLVVQFGTMAVLARLLSPDDFGLLAMAAAVTGFVGMFMELGLSTATVQRKTLDQNLVSAFFRLNLMMASLVTLAMVGLAPLAARFFEDPRLSVIIVALALTVPVLAASRQHAALLQRGMRWKAIQSIAFGAQVLASIAAILLAWAAGWGYWALVAQAWGSALFTTVALWAACPWRPGRVDDWRAVREPLGFGLRLSAFSFLNYFHRQFDDVLVGRRWGAEQLGYYSRAYALLMLPLKLINGPVGSVVLPALSQVADKPHEWSAIYRNALRSVVLFAAPMACLLMLLAPFAIQAVYGPQWDEAAAIFRALSLCVLAQPIMSSTGWLWTSTGQSGRMLTWAAGSIPVMVLGMLAGLPFGPVGVAIGYSVTFAALTPVCTWFAARRLPLSVGYVYRGLILPLAAALVALGACLAIWPHPIDSLAPACLASVTYLVVYGGIVGLVEPAIFHTLLSRGLEIYRHEKQVWMRG